MEGTSGAEGLDDGELSSGQQRPASAVPGPRQPHRRVRQEAAQQDGPGCSLRGAHDRAVAVQELPGAHIQRHQRERGVRDAAQGQLPRGGRRRRRQPDAAGHRNVHRVRQRLLHQPAVPERVAALRPAAVQRRRRHGRTGPHVRVHADEVQQGLHGGHDQDGQHQPAHWEAGPDQARLLQGQLASRYSASSCTYAGPSDPTIQQYVVVICSDHYNKAGLRHFSAACLIMCL